MECPICNQETLKKAAEYDGCDGIAPCLDLPPAIKYRDYICSECGYVQSTEEVVLSTGETVRQFAIRNRESKVDRQGA